jgi:flagellar hook-length control protein FliK
MTSSSSNGTGNASSNLLSNGTGNTPGGATVPATTLGGTRDVSFATALANNAAGPETGRGVAEQLVSVLTPLQTTPGGSRTVTLQLQPDGLGSVRAEVSTTDGSVTIRLWADSDAGHAALSSSLHHLETALMDDGVQGATVRLHSGPGGNQNRGTSTPGSSSETAAEDAEDPAESALEDAPIMLGGSQNTVDLQL